MLRSSKNKDRASAAAPELVRCLLVTVLRDKNEVRRVPDKHKHHLGLENSSRAGAAKVAEVKSPNRVVGKNGRILDAEVHSCRIDGGTSGAVLYVCFFGEIPTSSSRETKQRSLVLRLHGLYSAPGEFSQLLCLYFVSGQVQSCLLSRIPHVEVLGSELHN